MHLAPKPPANREPRTVSVIIPFPTVRRVGKIRRTVEVLTGKSGKDADRYWHQVIGGMRSQMKASGLPEDTVEQELYAFAAAVFGRVHRCGGDAA